MNQWIETIIRIATFRAGPQDLPGTQASLFAAIIVYALVAVTVTTLTNESSGYGPLIASFGVQLILALSVLMISNRLERFNQTMSALLATGALLGLINLPLWLMAEPPIPTSLAMLILAGLFWSLAIDGSIWRHALNRSFGFGLAVAVLLFVINFVIMQRFVTSTTPG